MPQSTDDAPAGKLEQQLERDRIDARSDQLLDAIRRIEPGTERQFEAKDVIYREGETADRLCVILRGLVKLMIHLPNGKVRIVRLHSAGDWLGIEGLGEQRPYEQTAVALTDVETACFALNGRIGALEQEKPELYASLLEQGVEYLEQANRWIAEFSTGSIKARLAHLLEFLSDLEFGKDSNVISLLTVNEIADILGVTPESVSRILAEFKRSRTLIKLDGDDGAEYRIDEPRLEQEKRE